MTVRATVLFEQPFVVFDCCLEFVAIVARAFQSIVVRRSLRDLTDPQQAVALKCSHFVVEDAPDETESIAILPR
jgi:hypothetical protein